MEVSVPNSGCYMGNFDSTSCIWRGKKKKRKLVIKQPGFRNVRILLWHLKMSFHFLIFFFPSEAFLDIELLKEHAKKKKKTKPTSLRHYYNCKTSLLYHKFRWNFSGIYSSVLRRALLMGSFWGTKYSVWTLGLWAKCGGVEAAKKRWEVAGWKCTGICFFLSVQCKKLQSTECLFNTDAKTS